MKPISFLLLSLSFTSCVQYQYLTIDGENIAKNENRVFVVENDEVKLTYGFTGYRGAVNISVFNKTNEPIEINWKKSALILNDNATSYFSPSVNITGQARTDSSLFFSTNSTFQAQGMIPPEIEFIPPNAAISRQLIQLPVYSFPYSDKDLNKRSFWAADGRRLSYKQQEFTRENSPLRFRSYVYLQNKSGKEISLNHWFYVSELKQTTARLETFTSQLYSGDFIYF